MAQIVQCTPSADGRLDAYDGMAASRIGVAYAGLADVLMPARSPLPTPR